MSDHGGLERPARASMAAVALRAAVAAAALVLAAGSGAAVAAPRVTRVITATADVHDVAVLGDRVLLATSGGLVVRRGDTVERVIGAADGLPGARLRSVSVIDGRVWVGGVDGAAVLTMRTASGGAVEDTGTLAVERMFALRRVTRVVAWKGSTWLATFGGGLHRLDGDGVRGYGGLGVAFAAVRSGDDAARTADDLLRVDIGTWRTRLTDLAVHGDRLWVASAGEGVAILDASGKLERVLDDDHGLPDASVWDLAPDGERMVIATSGGLAVWNGSAIEKGASLAKASRGLPIRDLRAVVPDGAGAIVASYGGGIWRLADGKRKRVAGERALRPRAIVRDGAALIVAHDRGAARTDAAAALRPMHGGGLHDADVTALARAFGVTWVATFGQGLARIDARGNVVAVDRAVERWGLDPRINDLAVTTEPDGERLWIATDHGLWWHDGRQFAPEFADGAPLAVHVTSLHVDASGALWTTSARTVARRAGGTWTAWTGDERTPMLQAQSITTDARGRVWIGSLAGLMQLDPATGTLTHHDVASGALAVDWVTSVVPWGDGIVAGTYHGGLTWFDGTRFTLEREGKLPAGWVNPHAMRRHGDRLWFGALDRGLVIGRRGAWTRLDLADGLPSRDVTAILPAADGHSVWVGTRGGLALITP